jgi:nitrate reductase delta subunit
VKPKPWKLLSVLLQYPEGELGLAGDADARLGAFLAWRRETPLTEQQQAYVETFDFDRRASLYLTHHTHGDRRQRGLELVRLKRRYAEAGLPLIGDELPDYLPVVLEFAALRPAEGEALLNELRAPLELIRSRLHETRSPYAEVVDSVVAALPRPTKTQLEAARRIASEGPPAELVGLEPYPTGAPS